MVPDYDLALDFYVGLLGFALIEDTPISAARRWVLVAPTGAAETRILLARAEGRAQIDAIGNQAGGRVGFFLAVADFDAAYARMHAAGVRFLETPRSEPYGKVAVWQDPFGNKWDLLEKG